MANPTTNFGWVMPTSSSLVTNLPADFNTFGQAVDTSMSELLGGTTGQVLSKTSATNMDFTWVTPTTGLTNPMTTTGDTIYSSSGSTPARLGIGSSGQVLTVTSGIPAWATLKGESWTVVASGSLSGTSVNLTSLSGYDRYIVLCNGMSVNTNDSFRVRLNNATTNYVGVGFNPSNNNSTTNIGTVGLDATATNARAIVSVSGCLSTTGYKSWQLVGWRSASTAGAVSTSGLYESTSAITEINIAVDAWAFDAGTYTLYGSN